VSRRLAREKALQVLYQAEMAQTELETAVEQSPTFLKLKKDSREFFELIAFGVWAERELIDTYIQKYVSRWKLERLSPVDRNILRLSIFEMLRLPDVPKEVAIDEAVELAKKYSSEKAAGFVNGILDGIRKELISRPTGE